MSDTFGSFNVRPGILERSTHLIDLLVRHRPETTAFRLWGATSIDDAYGSLVGSGLTGSGGTVVLEVPAGSMGQTQQILRRGYQVAECRKGHTSFLVDNHDVGGHGLNTSDDVFVYFRLQEERLGVWQAVPGGAPLNAGYPIRGPILVCPPAPFFAASASVMSLQSLAPLGTGCTGGNIPVLDYKVQTPLPLHILFPRPASTVTVTNHSDDDMLVSFGLGMPMMVVAAGLTTIPTGGGYSLPGVRELIVAADPSSGSAIPFTVEATIGMQNA